MIHAKTAVADGKWSRVGSTNLNFDSWFQNWELDVIVEDEVFSREMEAMFLDDISRSTEIVLDNKNWRRPVTKKGQAPTDRKRMRTGSRTAAGVMRLSY